MTRIAKEDCYAVEPLGDGMDVRRLVKAGTEVPAGWEIDADKVTETNGPEAAAPIADAGSEADIPAPDEDDPSAAPAADKPRSRGRRS